MRCGRRERRTTGTTMSAHRACRERVRKRRRRRLPEPLLPLFGTSRREPARQKSQSASVWIPLYSMRIQFATNVTRSSKKADVAASSNTVRSKNRRARKCGAIRAVSPSIELMNATFDGFGSLASHAAPIEQCSRLVRRFHHGPGRAHCNCAEREAWPDRGCIRPHQTTCRRSRAPDRK
jgi:hypothetical protein